MAKKRTKRTYRLRNWSDYNKALVGRGSLTVWIGEDVLAAWRSQARTGKRGKPATYSEMAILCMATLQEVYHLPLRATEGLMRSVVKLLGVELPVAHYTTLCRRRALEVALPRRATGARSVGECPALHVVVDATGIEVYGEGEWKVRQHGYSRRRTWRKLHFGMDEAPMEFVAVSVTTNSFKDSQLLPHLLAQTDEPIAQVSVDGAYDARNCYAALSVRGARAAIPPQKKARIWRHGNMQAEPLARDENLRRIRRVGRAGWKRESGYHRRSLAQTQVFRIKTIFGERVSAREL